MVAEVLERDTEELRAFIMERYLARRSQPVSSDEALVSSGIIDSLGLVDLTAFIEEKFDVFLVPDQFGAGRADSLSEVMALIERNR